MKEWIHKLYGKFQTESPLFDIDKVFKSSTKETPILLITTPGSDPLNDVRDQCKGILKELKVLSLGQGQGKQAQSLFAKCIEDGFYLMYQNTHLQLSWVSVLEKLVEDLSESNVDDEFRLILTTSPTESFPTSILQNSVKVSIETSGDVKQTMLNA